MAFLVYLFLTIMYKHFSCTDEDTSAGLSISLWHGEGEQAFTLLTTVI